MKKPHFPKKNETLNILGLMSGTSCDGLDLALVQTGNGFNVGPCSSMEYPAAVQRILLDFLHQPKHSLKKISQVNFYLAHLWSEMIEKFIHQQELSKEDIDLVASHGQTVWHQPNHEQFIDHQLSSTLQLGDPSVLANLLQIPVIGDFRVADMAGGGQGAPLIPFFDFLLFAPYKSNILSLNIGGISNITFIPATGEMSAVKAFDCGPGNMLIDGLCRSYFNEPFDHNGEHAQKGNFSKALFEYLRKTDDFYRIKPPKSSGREYYNQAFLQNIKDYCTYKNIGRTDALHTLTYFTAYTIHFNYREFIPGEVDTLVVSGGGAQNPFLLEKLGELFTGVELRGSSAYGIDERFKEAIGFAFMADATWRGKPSNVPAATGAGRPVILGKICLV